MPTASNTPRAASHAAVLDLHDPQDPLSSRAGRSRLASILHAFNPLAAVRSLWSHRELISQFTRREIVGRTRGTQLGWLWLLVNPLVTVGIFTFVFNMILQSKWEKLGGLPAEFPLTLLLGTAVFGIFADTLNEAPYQIVARPNYVTKVVFPVEIFPVCVLLTQMFFQLITIALVLVAAAIFLRAFSTTMYLFPVVLVPVILWAVGFGWILASLGVFLRDIRHVVALGVSKLLMFMTPLFYQIDRVPENLRWVIEANPLTSMVENARRTLLWSESPDWFAWSWTAALGLIVAIGGYAFFQKSKRGFADVL